MTVDPITFEVVKHQLWQINDEQATTIRTISTSPIVVEGNDFNAGLFTRQGDLVTAGPYVVSHVTTMDAVIKNVIKIADEVEDGDMFLVNDPYLGALHQNDVAIVSPLFADGEPVLWVGNVLHHADLAGIDEGSFCINAHSVYQEAPRYFLRAARGGKIDKEVERTFITNSRLPDAVALDLHAQIGAINVARRRMQGMIQQYGVELVLAVMEQTVDFAELQLRERIAELPDGSWSTEVFMDTDRVGSDRVITVKLRLEKSGDHLLFDYTGTDPQSDGAVNATSYACYAGTTTPVYTFLCGGEIDWNSSIRRCVEVYAPEGTVMNAQSPAPVSICSIGFTWLAAVAGTRVLAQMFSESDKYRDRVCSSWSVSCNANNLFGLNAKGKLVGALLSDHRGGGAGARSFADGFDNAGQIFSCFSLMSNVESQEWKLPLLYVYRRQLTDSGGPGKFRGGRTSAVALVPYRTKQMIFKSQNTAGADESNAAGIHGGYPGAGSQVSVVRNTRTWEKLSDGIVPLTYDEFEGEVDHLPSKAEGVLGPDDVLIFYPPGGGGYGDPLEREPEQVRRDVATTAVSVDAALKRYGVALDTAGNVDPQATQRERLRQRAERLGERSGSNGLAHSGSKRVIRRLGEYVEYVETDGTTHANCVRCGAALSEDGSPELTRAVARVAPLVEAGPWLALRWHGQSERFHLEKLICPGCGALLEVQERLSFTADPPTAVTETQRRDPR